MTEEEKQLASALGRIPSGLFIVTARRDGLETGMLASWIQQCSFAPPMLSLAMKQGRDLAGWLTEGAAFTVNVLERDQTDMIAHFGRGFALGEPAFEGLEVLRPREVPLGGPRAILVRRTLPQRQRSLIGAWCFADHYGPHDLRRSSGMDVAPHPHTALQTISWLFSGEVEHRDSAGVHAIIRPGELNLMTAGAGICHSEVSVAADRDAAAVLHGVQLWAALPGSCSDRSPKRSSSQ